MPQEDEDAPADEGVKINLISRETLAEMDTAQRIRFIVDQIKMGKVLVLERGLTAQEEMELIRTTMEEIDHESFIGVETPGFSIDLKRRGFLDRLFGRQEPPRMMVVGPAHLLQTIHKDGKVIEASIVSKSSSGEVTMEPMHPVAEELDEDPGPPEDAPPEKETPEGESSDDEATEEEASEEPSSEDGPETSEEPTEAEDEPKEEPAEDEESGEELVEEEVPATPPPPTPPPPEPASPPPSPEPTSPPEEPPKAETLSDIVENNPPPEDQPKVGFIRDQEASDQPVELNRPDADSKFFREKQKPGFRYRRLKEMPPPPPAPDTPEEEGEEQPPEEGGEE